MLRLCLAAVLTGHHRKILYAAFSLYLKGYCHRDFLTLFGRAISLRYYADTVFAFSVILPVLCFDTSSYCFYVGKQKWYVWPTIRPPNDTCGPLLGLLMDISYCNTATVSFSCFCFMFVNNVNNMHVLYIVLYCNNFFYFLFFSEQDGLSPTSSDLGVSWTKNVVFKDFSSSWWLFPPPILQIF